MNNADLYINLNAIPASIPVGQIAIIEAVAGNVGNDQVVANSIRMIVSGPINGTIIGIAENSDPRWSVVILQDNTIVMVNTNGGFGPFDIRAVFIQVIGTIAGPASTIPGNVTYITDHNDLLGGALNVSQGDASAFNNNSTTSLEVTEAAAPKKKLTISDYIVARHEEVDYMTKIVGEIIVMKNHKTGEVVKKSDFTLSTSGVNKGKVKFKK